MPRATCAGLPVPGDVDGMNVFPSLRDGTESPRRQIVHNVDEDRDKGAWQVGDTVSSAPCE